MSLANDDPFFRERPPSPGQAWLDGHPHASMAIAFCILVLMLTVTGVFQWFLAGQRAENFQSRWAAWFDYFSTDADNLVPIHPAPFITNELGLWSANPSAIGANSAGYRSPEFDEPAGKRPTILFTGASFTWGYSAAPLGKSLVDNVRLAGYRTLNFGVPASQVFLDAEIGEHYIPLLKPDAVIMMYAVDSRVDFPITLEPGHPFYHVTTAGWLLGYDKAGHPMSAADAHRYNLQLVTMQRPRPDADGAEEVVRAAYRKIQAACAAAGARAYLFVVPANPSLDHFQKNRDIAERYRDLDARMPLDVSPAHYAPPPDLHFNNEGHAWYAQYIVEQLQREGFEPDPSFPAVPYPYLTAPITLDSLISHFGLDAAQTEHMRAYLNRAKDETFALYARAPAGGGDSPAEFLARAIASSGNEAASRENFRSYAAGQTDPLTGLSYIDAVEAFELSIRAGIPELLRPEQRYWMLDFPVESVLVILTGYDPFGDFLAARIEEIKAADEARARWTLHRLKDLLQLDETQFAQVELVVNGMKDARAALLAQPPAAGGLAPIDLLAQLINAGDAEAPAKFSAYTQQTEWQPGTTYDAQLAAQEREAMEQVMPILTLEQRAALMQSELPSFAVMDSGYDPVAELLAERKAAVITPGTPASP